MKNITLTINTKPVDYDKLIFSGGEVQVRLHPRPTGPAAIWANIKSSEDLMTLFILTNALRQSGTRRIDLCMPYMPYARQDRVCAPGEALSLKVACDLINTQNYDIVEIWDAHSDVAPALLNNVRNRHSYEFVKNIETRDMILVAPDAGSIKKVAKIADTLGLEYRRADKTRDPTSGKITGTTVYTDHVGGKSFLIVDDICDGGRTFIELGRELHKYTFASVNLYITHGIFSKGTDVFDGIIDKVYVANSFVQDLPINFTKV